MSGVGFCVGGQVRWEKRVRNEVSVRSRGTAERKKLRATLAPPVKEVAVVKTEEFIGSDGGERVELPEKYSPEAIARYWDRYPLQTQKRFLEVSALLTPYLVSGFLGSKSKRLREDKDRRRRRAIVFREVLSKLGPAFIKLGQSLSARPDLVGPEAIHELQKLCDNVPAFENELAMQTIEETLGRPASEIFSEMTPDPIAAASLGQVYRARLRSTGEEVAVKVQRPDMLRRVTLDLYVLRKVFGAAQLLQDATSKATTEFLPLFDKWAHGTYDELDYVNEGRNTERFAELIYSRMDNVRVPRVMWEATSRRVLTTEWMEGIKIVDLPDEEKKAIIGRGVECFLTQMLDTGFFHADPHPGNLMINDKDELIVIDFGLMSELEPVQSDQIIASIIHLGNRDYERVVDDFIALDFLGADVDRKRVVPVLGAVLDQALEGGGAKSINFQSLSEELAAITFDFPFRIPPYFALLIRSLGVLEGIALTADPKFKLVMTAFPYVSKRMMSTNTPVLRKSFEEIIYVNGQFSPVRFQVLMDSAAGFLGNGDAFVDFDTPSAERIDSSASIEFVTSPQGKFVRTILANEVASSLDVVARSAAHTLRDRMVPRPLLGLPVFNMFSLVPTLDERDIQKLQNLRDVIKYLREREMGGLLPDSQALDTLTKLSPSAGDVGMMIAGNLSDTFVRRAFAQTRAGMGSSREMSSDLRTVNKVPFE